MSLFNSSRSEQQVTTNNNLTDQRVAATDSGIAAGAGASVTINDVSSDVAKDALDQNTANTRAAISGVSSVAADALRQNGNVALDSITSNTRTLDSALKFAAEEGSGSRELALSALKTSAGQKLPDALPQGAVNALVAPQSSNAADIIAQLKTPLLVGGGILALAVVVSLIRRN